MYCYIHYFISKHPDRSDEIFLQLIRSIQSSGLLSLLSEIRVVTNGDLTQVKTDFKTFEKVVHVAHEEEKFAFEFPTLKKMFDDSFDMQDDTPLLYMHLKGASKSANKNDYNWTEKMLGLVRQHDNLLHRLKNYDAIGFNLEESIVINGNVCRHFSGNFFWTKPHYVKTLPNPEKDNLMTTHGYMVHNRQNKNLYAPSWCNHRYLCEFWIGMKNLGEIHRLFDASNNSNEI